MMAYDVILARRVMATLETLKPQQVMGKKMFGGIGYMFNGNMACGVNKNDLIVRVGPDNYETALEEPHTRHFDLTGKPMRGWVVVAPEGCDTEDTLRQWVQKGLDYAQSLPPK
jgi:TfoX/Sxy family transcriptional regulator of competence genes